MKFFGVAGHDSRTYQLDFGGDLVQYPDSGKFSDFLMKFLEGWGMVQRTID